jgi:hypothetical protein
MLPFTKAILHSIRGANWDFRGLRNVSFRRAISLFLVNMVMSWSWLLKLSKTFAPFFGLHFPHSSFCFLTFAHSGDCLRHIPSPQLSASQFLSASMNTFSTFANQKFDLQSMLKSNDISTATQQHLSRVYSVLSLGLGVAALGSWVHLQTHLGGMLSTLATFGFMMWLAFDQVSCLFCTDVLSILRRVKLSHVAGVSSRSFHASQTPLLQDKTNQVKRIGIFSAFCFAKV